MASQSRSRPRQRLGSLKGPGMAPQQSELSARAGAAVAAEVRQLLSALAELSCHQQSVGDAQHGKAHEQHTGQLPDSAECAVRGDREQRWRPLLRSATVANGKRLIATLTRAQFSGIFGPATAVLSLNNVYGI